WRPARCAEGCSRPRRGSSLSANRRSTATARRTATSRRRARGTYPGGVDEAATRELGTGDLREFRRTGHALIDAVADHLAALPERPVWQPLPEELRLELLSLPLPDGPTGLGPLVGTMAHDVMPHAMGNGHPAFFGWVNPPPSLAGVLASLTAAAMNPSVVS